jgi:SAM-dependent methyltransferase
VSSRLALGNGWRRLWRHSYRLGARWVLRDARTGWRAGRTGWTRLLVPLDPWRYYELGRVAEQAFTGDCLDVASPKLLTSLLQHEGKGAWVGTDLFSREIDAWRRIDPTLRLEIADATRLGYPDASFDNVVCVSVLEHVGPGKDAEAVAEMWRVLKPGGILHLTTDVATEPKNVYVDERIYGEASSERDDRVFFKRNYGVDEIDALFSAHPWTPRFREYVVQRRPRIEEVFYAGAPWTYVYGPLLRFVCPRNFVGSSTPSVLVGASHGVVHLRMEKQAATDG